MITNLHFPIALALANLGRVTGDSSRPIIEYPPSSRMSQSTKPRKAKPQAHNPSGQPANNSPPLNSSPPRASSQPEMLQRWEVDFQKSNLPYTDWRWLPQDPKTKETK